MSKKQFYAEDQRHIFIQVMIVCGNMFVNLLPDNKYIKVYMVVLCGLLNYVLMKQHTWQTTSLSTKKRFSKADSCLSVVDLAQGIRVNKVKTLPGFPLAHIWIKTQNMYVLKRHPFWNNGGQIFLLAWGGCVIDQCRQIFRLLSRCIWSPQNTFSF